MRIWIVALSLIALTLPGCAPRVGSERWCERQRETPKGEWTLDETGDYAKYCVIGVDDEGWCKRLEEKPKGDWTANEAAEYAKSCLVDRSD